MRPRPVGGASAANPWTGAHARHNGRVDAKRPKDRGAIRWPASAILTVVLLVGIVGLVAVGAAAKDFAGGYAIAPNPTPVSPDSFLRIAPVAVGRPIAPGFVGLSIEYSALPSYAGTAASPNQVFEQMVRNIAPGQSPVLRIGGDSTDHTWWPSPGVVAPLGDTYALTPGWIAAAAALGRTLDARMILGINLEENDPLLAAAEANALVSGIGPRYVEALEVGNEPPMYDRLAWYRTSDGQPVDGRPPGYTFSAFLSDFALTAAQLGATPLAGPAVGNVQWLNRLGSFLAAEPAVRVVTVHEYPLSSCFTGPKSPKYPSIANLLKASSSRGLAVGIDRYAEVAHSRGLTFRVDEMNSAACGGETGVSDTFASALWVVDAMFAMARAGVDGVNIHTFPASRYKPFAFSDGPAGWTGTAEPIYYGMLMFERAAPPGSRLLPVSVTGTSAVRSWATRSTDGVVRVALINTSTNSAHLVQIARPAVASSASVERLIAPSASAESGVTLAGQSVAAQTRTGDLTGALRITRPKLTKRGYEVALPSASAAIVTIAPAARTFP